jgi:hypothetical protein
MPENFQLLIHEVPEITEAVWRYDSLFYDVSDIFHTYTMLISLFRQSSKDSFLL